MQNHQIDMKNPRLFEDFRLAESSPEKIREVTVVGTAYNSILCSDFTYVSTPITSGAVLYKAMDAAGAATPEDLQKDRGFFYDNVIRPNIENADRVAHALLALKGGAIIAPAAFEAKQLGWTQSEYMGLWLEQIENKATRIAMIDGWEYSNGGCEEYLQALLMQAGKRDRNNIEIVNERGELLSQVESIQMIASAVEDLLNRNFRPVVLARVLSRMVSLWTMVSSESDYGQSFDTSGRNYFNTSPAYHRSYGSTDQFRTVLRSIRQIYLAAVDILPASERDNRSSALMSPTSDHEGLVRTAGRDTLGAQGVTVLHDDDNENLS